MGVLRKWFGPSREEIWRQLCAEIGAEYVEGGFMKRDKVQVTHGEWTVTLDRFAVSTGKVVVVFTRMRAPYVNPSGFRFSVRRRGLFTDIGKWFGMQDVSVGHESFDHDFIVQGNDRDKLVELFANPKIRALFEAQPSIHLEVKDDEGLFGAKFPEGVDELRFTVHGIVKDLERLKQLFDLFAETLDQLCRIGAAYEKDPNVTL